MNFKKLLVLSAAFCFFTVNVFSQETDGDNLETNLDSDNEILLISENELPAAEEEEGTDGEVKASHGGLGIVPEAKRPKAADPEKMEKAAEKDENEETDKKNRETIRYGLPSEIADLMNQLIENEDPRYSDEIYDLFESTTNATIKQKVLEYFTKLEDPCLEDFAVELLNDPYDEKKDVVTATFNYVQAVKTVAAVPPVLSLIESENEDYFNEALTTIGEIGGEEEAQFIAEFLNRDDLAAGQRQILMRTLGKMHALSTWNQIVEILENEDENTYVRMYAAEALGSMEKAESVPVLVRNYSSSDPNLRQYVIKGLAYFPDVVEARSTIVQAVRDEYWKVRQEAIKICADKNITEAMPFLIYRAENDSEKVIKNNSFDTIAALNTQEGNDFLIKQLQDKKTGDTTKQKVVEVLLKEGHAGEKEILELADSCVNDDKHKNLRYGIGKALAKNAKPEYEDICSKYLASKDATTVSLGLDMYKNCKYAALEQNLRDIAADKKSNSGNRNRIKKMLNIEDEETDQTKTADNSNKADSSNKAASDSKQADSSSKADDDSNKADSSNKVDDDSASNGEK